MTTRTIEGFSISHAAILDGSIRGELAGPDLGDIYGVRDGALSTDEGQFDNTGDDAVLSSWFWFNHVNVTVKAGYISFDTYANMSGEAVTSSGAGANEILSVPLWTQESLNTPQKPMLVRVPAKDSDGATRELDFVLFKVQFAPIKFEGPSYKAGLVVDYSGRAVLSSKDELGNTLPRRAIGRLISTRPFGT